MSEKQFEQSAETPGSLRSSIIQNYGKVRNFRGIDAGLTRESKAHFDILCQRYPTSAIVQFDITDDGRIYAAVSE